MAAGNAYIRGITIKLGGDSSDLVKSFKEVNTAVKTTERELKDVNKLLKLDPGNTQLLIQKQQILNKQYTETAQKLEAAKKLRDALVADNAGGKNEEKIRAVNREIETLNKELENVKKNASGFSVLGEKVQAFGDKLKTAGTKIRDVGNSMTMHLTVPLVAVGTAAVKAASDYEENLNKVDVAFGKNADVVKDWAKTATESFGLSESHALEATALFGDMATSMGISTGQAANMSTQLAGLAGDLASFKNISQDQAMNALKAVFTGETEALKNLGIVMTQVNLEEFAEKQGKVYKEMSESEKVVLRYNYVLEKSKNAIGDYSRTSDGTANTIKTFREELDNLSVAVGQHLLPVITPVIRQMTEMVKAFGQLDPKVQEAIVKAGLFIAVAGPVVSGIGNMVIGIGNLVGLGGKAINFFAGLGGGATVASAGMKTAAAAATSTAATTEAAAATTTAAASGIGAAFSGIAAPLAFAVAGVTAATYQITTHWNELGETAKAYVQLNKASVNLFVADCNLLATKGRIAFTNFANAAKEKVNEGITAAKTTIQNGMSAAQSSINTFGNSARNTMQTTWSNISSRTSGAMTTIRSGISSGFSAAQSAASNAMNAMNNTLSNTWSAISSNTNDTMNTIRNNVSNAWSSITSTLNNTATTWREHISTMTKHASDFGGSVMNTLRNNVSSAWSNITQTIGNALSGIQKAVSNTTLKFGSVTIPTFSWTGKNDSEKGTTASIKVSSSTVKYASAMMGGTILKGATIFGAMGDKLLQAGEVGSEVVVGTNSLMNMIARTQRVNSNNQAVVAGISAIYTLLLEYLPESARQQQIVLDTGKLVGALTPSLNRQFGMMIRG